MANEIILIVTDDTGFAKELENRLSQLHYRVRGSAASMEAAMAEIQRSSPGLMLIDTRKRQKEALLSAAQQVHKRTRVALADFAGQIRDLGAERVRTFASRMKDVPVDRRAEAWLDRAVEDLSYDG